MTTLLQPLTNVPPPPPYSFLLDDIDDPIFGELTPDVGLIGLQDTDSLLFGSPAIQPVYGRVDGLYKVSDDPMFAGKPSFVEINCIPYLPLTNTLETCFW